MTHRDDFVAIQAPPLQEIRKKRSCLRRGCFSGCGCFFIVFILSLVFVNIITHPRPKKLDAVPAHIADIIPIYDKDTIQHISFLSRTQQGRIVETAAIIPKIILSPILLPLEKYTNLDRQERQLTIQNVFSFVQEPVSDYQDMVTIVWKDLPAEPNFIYEYYHTELLQRNMRVVRLVETRSKKELSFQTDTVKGSLVIVDTPQLLGTSSMTVTLYTSSTP